MEKVQSLQPGCRGALAGAAAGLVSGLLGAGGGMVLLPLLGAALQGRERYATGLAVMLPVCAVTALAAFWGGARLPGGMLPVLLGGALGGAAGGLLYRRIPLVWLRRGFAVLLLWAGIRRLLG